MLVWSWWKLSGCVLCFFQVSVSLWRDDNFFFFVAWTRLALLQVLFQITRSFIPDISVAPLQSTTTQKRSKLQHWYCVGVNMAKRYWQLWVKDLPKVRTWRLERDSNLWPSGRKAPNLPLSLHTFVLSLYDFGENLSWKWRLIIVS